MHFERRCYEDTDNLQSYTVFSEIDTRTSAAYKIDTDVLSKTESWFLSSGPKEAGTAGRPRRGCPSGDLLHVGDADECDYCMFHWY
jgi:hypothetical protein